MKNRNCFCYESSNKQPIACENIPKLYINTGFEDSKIQGSGTLLFNKKQSSAPLKPLDNKRHTVPQFRMHENYLSQ